MLDVWIGQMILSKRTHYFLLCSLSFRFFAVGSRDMSCRVYSVSVIKGYRFVNLLGHRSTVIACFFEQQSLNVSMLRE